jgi:hypothetical protein
MPHQEVSSKLYCPWFFSCLTAFFILHISAPFVKSLRDILSLFIARAAMGGLHAKGEEGDTQQGSY